MSSLNLSQYTESLPSCMTLHYQFQGILLSKPLLKIPPYQVFKFSRSRLTDMRLYSFLSHCPYLVGHNTQPKANKTSIVITSAIGIGTLHSTRHSHGNQHDPECATPAASSGAPSAAAPSHRSRPKSSGSTAQLWFYTHTPQLADSLSLSSSYCLSIRHSEQRNLEQGKA